MSGQQPSWTPGYSAYAPSQQQHQTAPHQAATWPMQGQVASAPSYAAPQAQQPYYSPQQSQSPYHPATATQSHAPYATSAYASSYPAQAQAPQQAYQPTQQPYSQPSQASPAQAQPAYGQPYPATYPQQQAQQQQPQQQPATAPYYSQGGSRAVSARTWVGTVTALIPPNYGIVDGEAFYVNAIVTGQLPQMGQRVWCEAIPNTDGGQYAWRCTRVELDTGTALGGHANGTGTGDGAGGVPSVPGQAAAPGSRAGGGGSGGGGGAGRSTVIRANGPAARSVGAGGGGATVGSASGEKTKYNSAPPPMVSYTADVALAVAANAVEGPGSAATAIAAPPTKTAPFAKPTPELTEEERRRAESAVQQLASYGDPSGVGARLLAKMGFGSSEGSKGGLGKNEQGIAAPVDPVAVRGNVGLGFVAHQQQQTVLALATSLPAPQPDRGSRRGWGRARGPDPDRERDRGRDRDRDRSRGRDRDRRRRSRSRSRTRSSSRSSSRSESHSQSRSSSTSSESRSRSRSRSASPRDAGGSSAAAAAATGGGGSGAGSGRYSVRPPKFHTWERVRGLASVSKRYKRLYIPSDFCRLEATWLETLPELAPLPLTNPIEFVFPTSVKAAPAAAAAAEPTAAGAPLAEPTRAEPADVASGRRWSVRVMLLSGVPEQMLYADDPKVYRHPLRQMRVVVQKRHSHHNHHSSNKGSGGSELGAVGGPWEPQDGGHPARDPGALVATAIRTFKQATGLDLSPCSQWVRFADVVYMRPAPAAAVGDDPVSSCPLLGLVEERVVLLIPMDAVAAAQPDPAAVEAIARAQDAIFGEQRARAEVDAAEEAVRRTADTAAEATRRAVALGGEDAALDPGSLTVVQLQEELSKRGLADSSVKKWNPLQGKKPLVDKLQEYLDRKRAELQSSDTAEGAEARAAVDARGAAEAAVARAREAREALAAAQKAAHEARKLLVNPPVVDMMAFAPPPRPGSSSRASLTSCTIDQLLDYGEDDTREAMFEVSVFAEMFREMLQQRYGRALLRGLSTLLQPPAPPQDGGVPKAPGLPTGAGTAAATEPEPGGKMADPNPVGNIGNGQLGEDAPLQDCNAAAPGAPADSDAGPIARPHEPSVEADASKFALNSSDTVPVDSTSAVGDGKRRHTERVEADMGVAVVEADVTPEGVTSQAVSLKSPGVKRQRTHTPSLEAEEAEAASTQGPTPEPFLAVCRMFDDQCAGYLDGDDLEEILYMTADNVSRRRVQAIVDQAVSKRGRFSYPEFGGLVVPSPRQLQPVALQPTRAVGTTSPLPSASGETRAVMVSMNGSMVDVARLQAKLEVNEFERRNLLLNAQRLEIQLAEQRRREAYLSDHLAALSGEVASLQARLSLNTSSRASVDTVFMTVLSEVQTAQARLAAAAAKLQDYGYVSGSV